MILKNLKISFLLLASITVITRAQQQCPLKLEYFTKSDCTFDLSIEKPAGMLLTVSEGECQFIEDTMYSVSCNSTTNSVVLDPCDTVLPYFEKKAYKLNTCLQSEGAGPGSTIKSFIVSGNCTSTSSLSEVNDCLSTTPAPIEMQPPQTNPPSPPPPAAVVELPVPPLVSNPFADDELLDVHYAHEVVYLAGRLIYVLNGTNVEQVLPDSYTFHMFKDTGSTEVAVITSDNNGNNNNKIWVVFRGTDESFDGDWLTNIQAFKVPYGPPGRILDGNLTMESNYFFGFSDTHKIRVHHGFNKVFSDGLYDTLLSVINPLLALKDDNDALYYNNTIHFIGHSLGGANAQVFGTYFAFFHKNIKTHVTSLGAPRQGNLAYKVLAESLDNLKIWRMVNCRDVVPRVPMFQFYHAGHLLWKKCDPPSSNKIDDGNSSSISQLTTAVHGVAEAYYRESGSEEMGYEKVPLSFVVKGYEKTIISDHLGGEYSEWLEYARSNVMSSVDGSQNVANWTSTFSSASAPSTPYVMVQ